MTKSKTKRNPVAIIGMAGRFPGAPDVDAFWRNLHEGKESVSFFSDQALLSSEVDPALLSNPNYIKAGAVLSDVDSFDAAFFGFSPREAELMDPQHRIFLECAWEAMENAGYDSLQSQSRIGVYAASGLNAYLLFNISSNPELIKSADKYQILISNDKDFLPTRVSYKLNLIGPSLCIQSACSSSLAAVHQACQSLIGGECDLALAGGVSIRLPQAEGYLYRTGGILSPDGHCRAFDEKARGTISGSGAGIVVLKRLAEAIRDGDSIHAVIRGSAINNDGNMKVGFTAPGLEGQAGVIEKALSVSGLKAADISYVEAHGTGTELGDPIEIAGLTTAFGKTTRKKQFCAIGSVKTNIGHLDAAAGVAGLIKTVLALKHGSIPPTLNFQKPNPNIDFFNGPFYVNGQLTEWKKGKRPRRAGVSSFGIGGTNVHAILEEAPEISGRVKARPYELLVLSAKSPEALQKSTGNLVERLKQGGVKERQEVLSDIAYTLQVGRRGFACRKAVVCDGIDSAVKELEKTENTRLVGEKDRLRKPNVVFVFPGEGSHHFDLGRGLYEAAPTFRKTVDRCSGTLRSLRGIDFGKFLFSEPGPAAAHERDKERISRAAAFVIEYALAMLWMEWGIKPTAMIGQGAGAYAAGAAAELFSPEEGLWRVTAPIVPVNDLSRTDPTDSTVEAVNGGIKKDQWRKPKIPIISRHLGRWITSTEAAEIGYWARPLQPTKPSITMESIHPLLGGREHSFLEMGSSVLTRFMELMHRQGHRRTVFSSLPGKNDKDHDYQFILTTLGRLWLEGCEVNWLAFNAGEKKRRVSLPTYPFDRRRYWIAPGDATRSQDQKAQAQKNLKVEEWLYAPSWEGSLPLSFAKPLPPDKKIYWLLFADRYGIGEKMAEQIRGSGGLAVKVSLGTEFRRLDDFEYVVDGKAKEGFEALSGALSLPGDSVIKIVWLWNLIPDERKGSGIPFFRQAQETGLFGLLFAAQTLLRKNRKALFDVVAVTNGIYEVTGEEALAPEMATVAGFCKVLQQEYENVSCRHIDITFERADSLGTDRLAGQVLKEALGSAEQSVAIRGSHRWKRTFQKIPPQEIDLGKLRQRGVYLITGGLGRLGYIFAGYLARSVNARLILTGRFEIPERALWEGWRGTHGEQDGASQRIEKITKLESQGAEVLYFSADAADRDRMSFLLDEARRQFGAVHGILHAAGVVDQALFQSIDKAEIEQCELQFRSKVHALFVLDEILKERGVVPDFCLLFSSLSTVLGGLEFMSYASANSFMDSFVLKHNRTAVRPWMVINWDAWLRENEEAASGSYRTSLAELAIGRAEGVSVFERLLSMSGLPQVIVSTGDLKSRIDQWTEKRRTEPDRASLQSRVHPRPELQSDYVAPRNEAERKVVLALEETLGLHGLGIHDDFFELGGDSLVATHLMGKLSRLFEIEISPRELFDAPTALEMTERILTLQWAAEQGEERPDVLVSEREEGVL